MKPQKRELSRFLNFLWPNGLPTGSWLTSASKNVDGQFHQRSWNNLSHATIAITRRAFNSDTYISCGVPDFKPNDDRRAPADKVSHIPGFWLDIDFGTKGHGINSYPPTIEQAYHLLAVAPDPTLVVESGHGLQVWWLFREPYEISNDASRQRLISTFTSLHFRVSQAAKQKGWKIDSTHDLARLLRPTGTLNHKIPDDVRPVILAVDDGPRWSLEDVEKELTSEVQPEALDQSLSPIREVWGESESSGIPWAALNASPVARPLMAGEPLDYPSASERDAALAKVATINGATRDQTQSLIHSRRIAAGENPAKALRDKYVDRTFNFVSQNGSALPTEPDKRLKHWLGTALPILVNERSSVVRVLVHMVNNARGMKYLGTRSSIESELSYSSTTVTEAWKCLVGLGIIEPINPNVYPGRAKRWTFLLPLLTDNAAT